MHKTASVAMKHACSPVLQNYAYVRLAGVVNGDDVPLRGLSGTKQNTNINMPHPNIEY